MRSGMFTKIRDLPSFSAVRIQHSSTDTPTLPTPVTAARSTVTGLVRVGNRASPAARRSRASANSMSPSTAKRLASTRTTLLTGVILRRIFGGAALTHLAHHELGHQILQHHG